MNITHKVCQHLPNNDNPFGWIYFITNTLNGKVYVGKVEFPRTYSKTKKTSKNLPKT